MAEQNFKHPIAKPPNPNRPDNYEAQMTPPTQKVSGQGFGLQQAPQTAPNQAPDFTPEETEAFKQVLQNLPEPELDNFIERLNAYRRIRRTIAKQQGKRLI